jgi:hypothetical protein
MTESDIFREQIIAKQADLIEMANARIKQLKSSNEELHKLLAASASTIEKLLEQLRARH